MSFSHLLFPVRPPKTSGYSPAKSAKTLGARATWKQYVGNVIQQSNPNQAMTLLMR
jgi:hypothetical protein